MTFALITWIISALALIIYFYFVIWLRRGLARAVFPIPDRQPDQVTPLSVIIAAHNEADFIEDTLQDLLNQKYPRESYEIIVVADRCSDRTVDIVKKMSTHNHILLIEIHHTPAGYSPKKYALAQGISHGRFPHMILMDADCRTGSDYLHVFHTYFAAGAEIVVNIPKFKPEETVLFNYLLPERLTVWSIAAAAVGYQRPFLAFGTSWGYTSEIYQKAGGLSSVAGGLSGDDDLLIRQMSQFNPVMAVCFQPPGWGRTRIPQSLKQFLVQRRRHHSAGKYYPLRVKLGYLMHHLSNLLLWISPLLNPATLLFLCAKWLVDFFTLKKMAGLFQEKISTLQFIIFETGYLLHHLLIAPLGFVGRIRWR